MNDIRSEKVRRVNSDPGWFGQSILFGLLAFALGLAEPIGRFDEALRDRATWLTPSPTPSSAVVVAVDEPALLSQGGWPWDGARVCQMLRAVLQARPAVVGLDPEISKVLLTATAEQAAALRQAGPGVPIVLSLRAAPETPRSLYVRGRRADEQGWRWGVIGLAVDSDGVVRRLQPATAQPPGVLGFEARLAAEARRVAFAAARAPKADAAGPWASERLRFAGPARSLPHVSLLRLGRGEIPATAIAGRAVLVGLTAGSTARMVSTPSTTGTGPMSEIEASGHAMQTLLWGPLFRELGPVELAALHVAAAAVFMLLFYWFGAVGSYVVLVQAILVTLAVTLALYVGPGILLPITSLVMLAMFVFAALMRGELVDHSNRLRLAVRTLLSSAPARKPELPTLGEEVLDALAAYCDCLSTALLALSHRREPPAVLMSRGFSPQELEALIGGLAASPRTAGGRSLAPRPGEPSATRVFPLEHQGRLEGYWVFVPRTEGGVDARMASAGMLQDAAAELAALLSRSRSSGGPPGASQKPSQPAPHDPATREMERLEWQCRETAKQRDFFVALLGGMNVGICTADLLGHVTYVDELFAARLARGREEVLLGSFFDLVGRLFAQGPAPFGTMPLVRRFEAAGRVLEREVTPTNGSPTYLLTWSALTDGPGWNRRVTGFVCTSQDVTRFRAMERLNAEAGSRLERTPCDLVRIANEAVAAVGWLAAERGCEVSLSPGPALPPAVADPVSLEHSLQALLRHSIENSAAGGKVRVALQEEHGWLSVDIQNDGFGLPQEAARRFFDSPAGLEAASTTASGGLKMPPEHIRSSLAAMGGWVQADARVGSGTRFRVWLQGS